MKGFAIFAVSRWFVSWRRSLMGVLAFSAVAYQSDAELKHFTGIQSGDWNASQNWSPAGVPGPHDTAVITGHHVNEVFPAVAAHSIHLRGGSLQTWSSLHVVELAMFGGNLTNQSSVRVERLLWTAGNIVSRGTTRGSHDISVSGECNIGGAAPRILDSAYLYLEGASVWTNGGTISLLEGARIFNHGEFYISNGGIVNAPWEDAQLLNLQNPQRFYFVNTGTLTIANAPKVRTLFDVVHFYNQGQVIVEGGDFSLNHNIFGWELIHPGSFHLAEETSLTLSNGTHVLTSSNSITGPGRLRVTSSHGGVNTHLATTTLNLTHLDLIGGEISVSHAVVTNLVSVNGYLKALANAPASLTIPAGGTIFVDGPLWSMTLGGVTVSNFATGIWKGGVMRLGRFNNYGTLEIHGDGQFVAGSSNVFYNYGQLIYRPPLRMVREQNGYLINFPIVAQQNYILQRSSDLASWDDLLQTNSPSAITVTYRDQTPGSFGFYRITGQ